MSAIIQGDALTVLKTLKSESVHMMITSPPYFGLRNYKTDPLVWGGSVDCQYEWGEEKKSAGFRSSDNNPGLMQSKGTYERNSKSGGRFCSKCGAWLGSLGNETNPDLYVNNLVQIFREVKRVLRPEGTVWLNLGTSFISQRLDSEEMILREDLTKEEISYVFNELEKNVKK